MRSLKIAIVLSLGTWALFALASTATLTADRDDDKKGNQKIALVDDCDPAIAAGWNTATDATQCIRDEGTVSRPEFGAFLVSPLSAAVVGHPAWTISPSLTVAEAGKRLRVTNAGGRGHTFTRVANFGGGFVPALSAGLATAPECAAAAADPTAIIAPGARRDVTGLSVGTFKFQCCIHSWMHGVVKIQPEN